MSESPVLRVRGRVLTGREEVRDELWVVGGRVTFTPPAAALEVVDIEGWALPGLVDAHCHVGLDAHGAVDDATSEKQARTEREAGCPAAARRGLRRRHPLDRRPRRPAAARPRRPPHRPYPPLHPQLRPRDRTGRPRRVRRPRGAQGRRLGQARRRLDRPRVRRPHPLLAARGPGPRDRRGAPPRRPRDRPLLRRGLAARPGRGGHRLHRARHGPHRGDRAALRRARRRHRAHARQHRDVPGAGGRRPGQVPALGGPHAPAARPPVRHRARGLRQPASPSTRAPTAGGSLAHGLVGQEVGELVAAGIPVADAVSAAAWGAREWLGRPGLEEGAPADLVVYEADPLADVGVLTAPRRIVLRGRVVG